MEGSLGNPRLDTSIDVAAYQRACPASATTLGTFFQFVSDLERDARGPASSVAGAGARSHWVAWNRYPLSDFMRLAVEAARSAHRDQPLAEGLRRIGRMAYPSFAATMAGRVILYAFGDDVDAMMEALPRAYSVSLSHVAATSRRVGPHHWEVQMRQVYNFASTYHLGVLEGAFAARGFAPDVRVHSSARLCDVDFDVRW